MAGAARIARKVPWRWRIEVSIPPPAQPMRCGRGRRLTGRGPVRDFHRSSETDRLMSNSIILLPFVAAFLAFVLRFYFRESASSLSNPSFLLAVGTVLIIVLYLALG